MTSAHPRHELDEVIHAPVRLSLMAALDAADSITFAYLRDLVEVSDSLLSKQIGVLEAAGYVDVTKGYVGKRPRTWYSLTSEGRAAFRAYQQALQRLLNQKIPDHAGGPAPHEPE